MTRAMNKKDQNDEELERNNWIDGYTTNDLSSLQREDADLSPLHDRFDNGTRPSRKEAAALSPATRKYWLNWENISRKKGILYQNWISTNKKIPDVVQVLIPHVLKREILVSYHDAILAAHLGVNKTVSKLKQRFYWYNMKKDVKSHIRKCKNMHKK